MSNSRILRSPKDRNAPQRGSPLNARKARQAEAVRAMIRRTSVDGFVGVAAAHISSIEQPEAFSRIVGDFVARH